MNRRYKNTAGFFASSLCDNDLLPAQSRLLVGVSGGLDSMVLVDLLHKCRAEFGWVIHVCHVNFHLRGEESNQHARFVAEQMASLGIDYCIESCPLQRDEGSLQEKARDKRFEVFAKLIKELSMDRLVLAHHADDQAELFFMRVLGGAGLRGVSGMRALRDGWVARPLLNFTRQELASYAASHNVAFVEDSSNEKQQYLRNRVRQQLIPTATAVAGHQAVVGNISRLMTNLAEEDDFLEEQAANLLDESLLDRDGMQLDIKLPILLAAPRVLQRRALQRAAKLLKSQGISRESMAALLTVGADLEGSSCLPLGSNLFAYRDFDVLRMRVGSEPPAQDFNIHIPVSKMPRTIRLPHMRQMRLEQASGARNAASDTIWVDMRALSAHITIRNLLPGDRMKTPRTRKISRILMDKKIGRLQRRRSVIVAHGEDVVGLMAPGLNVVDKRFAVTQSSQQILSIQLERE